MAKVERFFHLRPVGATKGGATVRVLGDTERVGQVDVQVARCSHKDPFCKKTGRDLAAAAPVKVVALRYLPAELGRVADKVARKTKQAVAADYTFGIKYFLPKE